MKICLRLLVFFFLLTLLTPVVFACECLPRRSPRRELKISKVVFVGTVVEANVGGRNGLFRFRVERKWKGASAEFMTVSSGRGTCASLFRVGETYLVYALEEDSELESNVCMRTALLRDADKDLKALGHGKVLRSNKDETRQAH